MCASSLYHIPAPLPFLDILAEHLLQSYGAEKDLARVLVLLPNRRSCLALRKAFLEMMPGQGVLLPRIEPIDSIDPAVWMPETIYQNRYPNDHSLTPISHTKRVLQLAELVHRHQDKLPAYSGIEQAVMLASALINLMDDMMRQQIPMKKLYEIVPEDLAEHWQISCDFLNIVIQHWPRFLKQKGWIENSTHRHQMLSDLTVYWKDHPPEFPVIAAGTTGSIPVTATLLSTIADMPEGCVVLHGLDVEMNEQQWQCVGPTHPQYLMKQLLGYFQKNRTDVVPLTSKPLSKAQHQRIEWLRHVMLPPEMTEAWYENPVQPDKSVHYLQCASDEQEAQMIALKIREAIHQDKTILLVTHDQVLAKQVTALLKRFDLHLDDTFGEGIRYSKAAVFLRLIMEVCQTQVAPVALLGLLEHPYFRAGYDTKEIQQLTHSLHLHVLRGVRQATGWQWMYQIACNHEQVSDEVAVLISELEQHFKPIEKLLEDSHIAYHEVLHAHIALAETLSTSKTIQHPRLWEEEEGIKLKQLIQEMMVESEGMEPIDTASYSIMLWQLLSRETFSSHEGSDPRVRILDPVEARLQKADRVILGHLNEGSWPPDPKGDPWMNQEMRAQLGLPLHTQSIGQSAHDFEMLCAAPEVILTHCLKQRGAPTIPSRWLLRMQATLNEEESQQQNKWFSWTDRWFVPGTRETIEPPCPSPDVSARPTDFSVTTIERLMRDPYSVYASKILRLKKLEPVDKEIGAAEFGNIVHTALQRYTENDPESSSELIAETIKKEGRQLFDSWWSHTKVRAFWWPRFERIAKWVEAQTKDRKQHGLKKTLSEHEVRSELSVSGIHHTIHARIDRIEQYNNGSTTLVDYKTGGIPKTKHIETGVACQMAIESWLLQKEYSYHLQEVEYWKLRGKEKMDQVNSAYPKPKKIAEWISETEHGLHTLLTYFRQPQTYYLSEPNPEYAPAYNDYRHLARTVEWAA